MSINSSVAGTTSATNGAVLVLARLLLTILFIFAGFGKLTDIAGTAGWFGSIGLPAPTALAVLVGLLELVGGLAILVGFKTRIAAVALAVFTIAATLVAHTDLADQTQMLMFLKNLSITGGLLVLCLLRPRRAVDRPPLTQASQGKTKAGASRRAFLCYGVPRRIGGRRGFQLVTGRRVFTMSAAVLALAAPRVAGSAVHHCRLWQAREHRRHCFLFREPRHAEGNARGVGQSGIFELAAGLLVLGWISDAGHRRCTGGVLRRRRLSRALWPRRGDPILSLMHTQAS